MSAQHPTVDRAALDREWLTYLERAAHECALRNETRARNHRVPLPMRIDPEEVSRLVDLARKGMQT